MTTYIVRASHANQYELQNYEPLVKNHDIKLITSRHPLTSTTIPTVKLWSPTDLPRFPYRRQVLNRLIGGEQWLLGFEKVVKKDDILHTAETYTPYTHQAVILRKQKKIKKLVCTCWETIPHNNEKLLRFKKWKKEAQQYVDLFHTPTQLAKKALIIEGVNPSKIKVINYGVDLSRFKNKSELVVNSKPIVLTVARRVGEKGLNIWNKLRLELGDQIEFRWLDNVPYSQINREYQKADIFLLPSISSNTWEEQYGMVIIEAMASGLPIITTKTGAIPEIVGNAVNLCSPTYSSIKMKILELVNSPPMRRKFQLLSYSRSRRHFDRDKQAELLSSLY